MMDVWGLVWANIHHLSLGVGVNSGVGPDHVLLHTCAQACFWMLTMFNVTVSDVLLAHRKSQPGAVVYLCYTTWCNTQYRANRV